jgi:hypothetical protein
MGPFNADDMHRWPMGARKTELLDGEVIFYGGFDDTDLERARSAFPDVDVRLEPDDEGNNLIIG